MEIVRATVDQCDHCAGWLLYGTLLPSNEVVCPECLEAAHIDLNGDYWESIEELYEHWEPYWWALEKND